MWEGHENLCLQVAELDAYAGGIRTDCNRLQRNMAELEQNQEMISDGTDAIHYAVVEMGGYVSMSELTAEKRRHMYVQERGNMVAANTVGQQQYLQVIRQQNHGFAVGQDTDVRMEEGERNGESENDSDADDLQLQLKEKDLGHPSSICSEMRSTMPCVWRISEMPASCRG
jgi:hypothetical protein